MSEHQMTHGHEAAEVVSRVIRARRARTGIFRPGLFSDPAWDILLVLFLAKTREQTITVAELADAVCTTTSTAFRWMDALARDGLLWRNPDSKKTGKDRVALSHRGTTAIYQWLEAMDRCQ